MRPREIFLFGAGWMLGAVGATAGATVLSFGLVIPAILIFFGVMLAGIGFMLTGVVNHISEVVSGEI